MEKRKHLGLLALTAAVALAAGLIVLVAVAAEPARAAFPGKNGKIAFASVREPQNTDIYAMDPNGTNQSRLTDHPANDSDPAFSPDGKKIAFMSDRDGNNEIYVMNADGSGQARLTDNPAHDTGPTFSPDGTKLSFTSERDGNQTPNQLNMEIWVMDANGANQVRLTNNSVEDHSPSFSPDGTKIAFERNVQVFVMNADGSNQTNLTNTPEGGGFPSFSPDGTKIAFQREVAGGGDEIFVMSANGTNQTNLTNTPEPDGIPDWGRKKPLKA